MQIKHIPGVGLPAGWPAKHERHLAVGHSLLGEIIIDDQDVFSLIHEVFRHRAARVGSEKLIGGGVRGRSGHHNGILHRPSLFQRGNCPGNIGLLLPDRHVDAVERLVVLQGPFLRSLILLRLRNNRIHRNSGLAGGAVSNNELSLSPPNRNHGINCSNPRLHRHAH